MRGGAYYCLSGQLWPVGNSVLVGSGMVVEVAGAQLREVTDVAPRVYGWSSWRVCFRVPDGDRRVTVSFTPRLGLACGGGMLDRVLLRVEPTPQ